MINEDASKKYIPSLIQLTFNADHLFHSGILFYVAECSLIFEQYNYKIQNKP